MKMQKGLSVNKTPVTKMNELCNSLYILKDCLSLYRKGKYHFILPICGQLRALLVRKRQNRPLLFDMAKLVSYEPIIYVQKVVDTSSVQNDSSSMFLNNIMPTQHKISVDQEQHNFEDWLKHEAVHYVNSDYSYEELICEYTEKSGGAHYDPDQTDFFVMACSIMVENQPIINWLILSIAEVTLNLGIEIIRKACCFERNFLLAINPNQSITDIGYICENIYPYSGMAYRLALDSTFKLNCIITNMDGKAIIAHTEKIVDWTKPIILTVIFEITKFLESELTILIDGNEYGKNKVDCPIFFISNTQYYERYYNRDKENKVQPLEFGIGAHRNHSGIRSLIDRYNDLYDLSEEGSNKNYECNLYDKSISGYGKFGESNITYSNGTGINWSLIRIANGELPSTEVDS